MICIKTNSEFSKLGDPTYQPKNLCYYHHKSSDYRISNFDPTLIKIMIKDRYSCDAIKNHLLAKLREFEYHV